MRPADQPAVMAALKSNEFFRAGVANPRPAGRMRSRKEFLKLGDFSIFWVFFHSFYQNLAQKVNIFGKFPKCSPKTDLGWPPLFYGKILANWRAKYKAYFSEIQSQKFRPTFEKFKLKNKLPSLF
jgi:hypothetical protein